MKIMLDKLSLILLILTISGCTTVDITVDESECVQVIERNVVKVVCPVRERKPRERDFGGRR